MKAYPIRAELRPIEIELEITLGALRQLGPLIRSRRPLDLAVALRCAESPLLDKLVRLTLTVDDALSILAAARESGDGDLYLSVSSALGFACELKAAAKLEKKQRMASVGLRLNRLESVLEASLDGTDWKPATQLPASLVDDLNSCQPCFNARGLVPHAYLAEVLINNTGTERALSAIEVVEIVRSASAVLLHTREKRGIVESVDVHEGRLQLKTVWGQTLVVSTPDTSPSAADYPRRINGSVWLYDEENGLMALTPLFPAEK